MTEDSTRDNNITLFDIKYKDATERLNSLILSEEASNTFSIKNFIKAYRIELSQEKNKSQKNSKSKSKNKNNTKRIKLLRVKEIPLKDKIAKQYYNHKYLNKEIEWQEIKQRERKMRSLINNNNINQKFNNEPLMKEISKDLERNYSNLNNYYMNSPIKFNNNRYVRKIQIKKSNDNFKKNFSTLNSNIIDYNLINEMKLLSSNKNNKNININNLAKINIKMNKSEKIYPIKKIKIKHDINNILSRNINHNNIYIGKEDGGKNMGKNLSYKYLLNKYELEEEKYLENNIN